MPVTASAALLAFASSGDAKMGRSREYKRGKYHCTVDLLLDWFGIGCM